MADAIFERFETQKAGDPGWDGCADIDWGLQPSFSPGGGEAGEKRRAVHRHVLSQLFYGDQAALHTCGQIIPVLSELRPRLYLAAQAADEARHVDALGRYLNLLGGPSRPGPHFLSLLQSVLSTPNVEEKLVGVHVLIEGLALDTCRALLTSTEDQLLRQVLANLARDEARHLEFVLHLLGRHFEAGGPKRRRDVQRVLTSQVSDLLASARWHGPEVPAALDSVLPDAVLRENLASRLESLGLRPR